jgi:hypothetical protein
MFTVLDIIYRLVSYNTSFRRLVSVCIFTFKLLHTGPEIEVSSIYSAQLGTSSALSLEDEGHRPESR